MGKDAAALAGVAASCSLRSSAGTSSGCSGTSHPRAPRGARPVRPRPDDAGRRPSPQRARASHVELAGCSGSPSRVRFRVDPQTAVSDSSGDTSGGSLIEMPPAVAQGRVVFGTHDGTVIGADSDGTIVWSAICGLCVTAVRGDRVHRPGGAAPCGKRKDVDRRGRRARLRTGSVL